MSLKTTGLYALLALAVFILPAKAQQPPAVNAAPVTAPSAGWMKYKAPYIGEYQDISKPHRTGEEISTWAQEAVSEVLFFSPDNYGDRLSSFKKYFIKEGWIKYAQYLQSSGLINEVVNNGYSIGTIVNNRPEIINKGATDNIYHWIIKMPITISVFRVNNEGEAKTRSADPYILYLDLKRIKTSGDDETEINEHIAIYDWRIDKTPN